MMVPHPHPHHRHSPLGTFVVVVHAMKHTVDVPATRRTIIGPLGIPFGFTTRGYYQITVSNFQLSMRIQKRSSNDKNKKKTTRYVSSSSLSLEEQQEIFEPRYEAGFYLQRYDTMASFHQHYNQLVTNIQNSHSNSGNRTTISDTCSFAHWLSDDILLVRNDPQRRPRQLQRPSHRRQPSMHDDDDDAAAAAVIVDDDGPTTNLDDFAVAMRNNNNNNQNENENGDDALFPDDTNDDDRNSFTNNGHDGTDDPTYDDGYAANPPHGVADDVSSPWPPSTPTKTSTNNGHRNDDDQVYYQDHSVYTSAQPHGIYLSLHSVAHTWHPHQPHLHYTFAPYVRVCVCVYIYICRQRCCGWWWLFGTSNWESYVHTFFHKTTLPHRSFFRFCGIILFYFSWAVAKRGCTFWCIRSVPPRTKRSTRPLPWTLNITIWMRGGIARTCRREK